MSQGAKLLTFHTRAGDVAKVDEELLEAVTSILCSVVVIRPLCGG